MPKRQLPLLEDLSAEGRHIYNEMSSASDMITVVLGASFLDVSVAALLHRSLRRGQTTDRLIGDRGPIGSFAARADLAYCMKLINKPLYQDLIQVAEMRNEFAHEHQLRSFSTPSIAQRCAALSYLQSMPVVDEAKAAAFSEYTGKPRALFIMTVIILSLRIVALGKSIEPHSDA